MTISYIASGQLSQTDFLGFKHSESVTWVGLWSPFLRHFALEEYWAYLWTKEGRMASLMLVVVVIGRVVCTVALIEAFDSASPVTYVFPQRRARGLVGAIDAVWFALSGVRPPFVIGRDVKKLGVRQDRSTSSAEKPSWASIAQTVCTFVRVDALPHSAASLETSRRAPYGVPDLPTASLQLEDSKRLQLSMLGEISSPNSGMFIMAGHQVFLEVLTSSKAGAFAGSESYAPPTNAIL
ncbi:uncharacterized protein LAESUDRAFT_710214 [Laetiporus sulphureus 93-53]|uniref:Uncharacterized protein n=1 Tax=Laetiporus sulphureus 93-53 TaxID=1314785 RepID=A0A165IJC3_9APHY|nr:uncharacterized protein LAESUDRAFT_710214 [Laetiporus sulphureus 93-53]KZT13158.1 hypothetical protein LAESUDRAFT_710214 [Laetiporus sulphureus 93-53]